MLDPGLEHLHRHGRVWRWTTERRRLTRELQIDLLLLVPVVALLAFAPTTGWGHPIAVVLVFCACVGTALVRFEIGSGSTSPLLIALVSLWYIVPPAWLTPVGALVFATSRLIERARADSPPSLWRTFQGAADAWPLVGPAFVLAVAGQPPADVQEWDIFVIALLAGIAVDLTVSTFSAWYVHGIRAQVQLRLIAWIVAVDLALAPVGFLGAVVLRDSPWVVVALMPLVLVLGEFARERQSRLDQAMQLSSAYRGTAQLMGDVLEADHEYTGGEHTQGVVDLAVAVGLELRLPPRAMRDLEFGALLHDIGKLRVPNEIINKPSHLTEEEWAVMREHPIYGQEMLDRVGGALTEAGRIVRAHHERWDGTGYPDGLVGEAIPREARIITVCDSFSAMTTERSYSRARTFEEAVAELDRCAGRQFDPLVVAALQRVLSAPEAASDGLTSEGIEITAAARALGLRTTR